MKNLFFCTRKVGKSYEPLRWQRTHFASALPLLVHTGNVSKISQFYPAVIPFTYESSSIAHSSTLIPCHGDDMSQLFFFFFEFIKQLFLALSTMSSHFLWRCWMMFYFHTSLRLLFKNVRRWSTMNLTYNFWHISSLWTLYIPSSSS